MKRAKQGLTHEQAADAIRAAFGCGVSDDPVYATGANLSRLLTDRTWGVRFHRVLAHAYRAGQEYRKGMLLVPVEHWRLRRERLSRERQEGEQ